MTVSILNNKTAIPNETIASAAYDRLCHSLATIESALRHVKVNACRTAPPTTEQTAAIHNHIIAIATELGEAIDELKYHDENRQHQNAPKDDDNTDKILRQLNLE